MTDDWHERLNLHDIIGRHKRKGMSLEQIVIDTYIWENARKSMTPFGISKETAALDVIRRVGHGSTFFQNIYTAKNLRKEIILRKRAKGKFEATFQGRWSPRREGCQEAAE
jgi:hypothetical protein